MEISKPQSKTKTISNVPSNPTIFNANNSQAIYQAHIFEIKYIKRNGMEMWSVVMWVENEKGKKKTTKKLKKANKICYNKVLICILCN